MKKFKIMAATFMVAVFGTLALAPAVSVSAIDPLENVCNGTSGSQICDSRNTDDAGTLIGTIVNTLLFVVGALSVVMIIVAGVFYVISSGDAGKVARAKNTLTYAIVGLVVSFLAYAIVYWVFRLL